MKPQHRKLPKSMRHKTLDLRTPRATEVTNSHSKPIATDLSRRHPNKLASSTTPPQHSAGTTIVEYTNNTKITPQTNTAQPETKATEAKTSKSKRKFVTIAMVLLIVAMILTAAYILWLMFTPKIHKSQTQQEVQKATTAAIEQDKDMIFIPSVGIQAEIKSGDVSVLDQGLVWHRFPERGDPTKGGNMVLTGHSFVWGYTPKQVEKQSIFFNLHDAKVGDDVKVVWDKKTYNYKITELKDVKPNATEIESETKQAQLTIYTCTSGGSADGRVVVIAKPI